MSSPDSQAAVDAAVQDITSQLSDRDRIRIRAEEIFRSRVRENESQKPLSGSARWFKFLNQPVILWFLSTVVVGLISWQYANWEERREQRRLTQTEIRSIDLEIHSRVRRADARLTSARDIVGVREAIRMLDQPSGMFVELGQRNMESLLISLVWLLPKEAAADVKAAQDSYQQLQAISAMQEDSQTLAGTIELVRETHLRRSFAIRSWGK